MGIIEKIAVDDATMARLAEDAQRNGRTVADEAAAALMRQVGRMTREEFLRRADEIAAMTPKDVKQTDSAVLLREDRDR
jgi:predicted nuclease with TOPRIM domain